MLKSTVTEDETQERVGGERKQTLEDKGINKKGKIVKGCTTEETEGEVN